jgi:hypothetical protein
VSPFLCWFDYLFYSKLRWSRDRTCSPRPRSAAPCSRTRVSSIIWARQVPPRRQGRTPHAHREEGVPPRVRSLRGVPRSQSRKARKLHQPTTGDVRVREGRIQEGQLRPRIHLLITNSIQTYSLPSNTSNTPKAPFTEPPIISYLWEKADGVIPLVV